jgi:hypothetical protein
VLSGVVNILMLTSSVFMMQVYDRVLGSRTDGQFGPEDRIGGGFHGHAVSLRSILDRPHVAMPRKGMTAAVTAHDDDVLCLRHTTRQFTAREASHHDP